MIKGKPAVFNGLRKEENLPIWQIILLVFHFSKIPLFSEELISFMILLSDCLPALVLKLLKIMKDLVLLLNRSFPVSKIVTGMFLSLARLSKIFAICIAILSDILRIGINPSNCTILDSLVFENFILIDEPFAKAF